MCPGANKLYGLSMSHLIAYDEIKFDRNVTLEDTKYTPDDRDIGYFGEVELKCPDEIKHRTKKLPFAPENKFSTQDKFTKNMNEMKP